MKNNQVAIAILVIGIAVAAVLIATILLPWRDQEAPPTTDRIEAPLETAPEPESVPTPMTIGTPVSSAEGLVLAGYMFDLTGTAIPGITVTETNSGNTAETDAEGRYVFGSIASETASLRADQAPYLALNLKEIRPPMEDAILVLCKGGSIQGTVKDILSRPMGNMRVETIRTAGPSKSYPALFLEAVSRSPRSVILQGLDEQTLADLFSPDTFEKQTAVTDAEGAYSLDRLPPGKYTVRALHDTYVAKPSEGLLLDWEQTVGGIDFTLESGYRVLGKAYEEKSGSLIAGVTVSESSLGKSALSQQDGTYSLGPLPPGSFQLTVTAPPEYVLSDSFMGRPGPEVNVTSQNVEGIDIPLLKAGLISGRVLNSNRDPVPEARVSLALRAINPTDIRRMSRLGMISRGQRTDADGKFRIERVPTDQGYLLNAGKEGYAPGQYGPFDLGEGEWKEDVEIVLNSGGAVSGRVSNASGEPIEGYHLFCMPGENFFAAIPLMSYDELRRMVVSDSDGQYQFEHISPGRNVVFVYRHAQPSGGLPKAQRTVEVVVGEELKNIDFSIDAPPLEGTIRGRVLNSEGKPVPQVMVMAMAKNMMMGAGNQEGFQSTTVTKQDGSYELADLHEKQEYTVLASDIKDDRDVGKLFSECVTKTVTTSAENVDLILPGRGGIAGRVVYKLTGLPVTSFSLSAIRHSDSDNPLAGLSGVLKGMFGASKGQAFTSSNGDFTLENLMAGTYNLEISGDGFLKTTSEDITVQEKQVTQNVRIEVEAGKGIQGIVLDAETKAPVEGAEVTVQTGGFGAMMSLMGVGTPQAGATKTTTDAQGRFLIADVQEGTVTLSVSHAEYSSQTVGPIDVSKDTARNVEVSLYRGGRIEGHVYGSEGQPAAGIQLTIMASDSSASFQVTADSEGFYSKDRVPSGHYVVGLSFMNLLTTQWQGALRGQGEVREGETAVIDIGSSAGVSVEGIVSLGGKPQENMQVLFVLGSERQMFTPGGVLSRDITGADGSYLAAGLPSGSAKLLVSRVVGNAIQDVPRTLYRRDVTLPEQGKIRVDIDLQLARISGSVRDGQAGNPIENALLILYPDLREANSNPFELQPGTQDMATNMAKTGSDGRYVFEEIGPGAYLVSCRAEGYGQQAITVTVDSGPRDGIDFPLLKQVGEITGTVTDRNTGKAIPSAVVSVIDRLGQLVLPAGSGNMGMIADANGHFRVDSITPGEYAVMCGDPIGSKYAWTRLEGVAVQAGQPTELSIVLERGIEVILSLVDPDGKPVLGATWRLQNERGISLAGQTMEIGNTLRTSLTPGSYTAMAQATGFQPARFPFVIEPGQTQFSQAIRMERM